jgi:hypothetical protein
MQSWIVGCGAAQKKERNVAQTERAVKQDRLCVGMFIGGDKPDVREASHIGAAGSGEGMARIAYRTAYPTF